MAGWGSQSTDGGLDLDQGWWGSQFTEGLCTCKIRVLTIQHVHPGKYSRGLLTVII